MILRCSTIFDWHFVEEYGTGCHKLCSVAPAIVQACDDPWQANSGWVWRKHRAPTSTAIVTITKAESQNECSQEWRLKPGTPSKADHVGGSPLSTKSAGVATGLGWRCTNGRGQDSCILHLCQHCSPGVKRCRERCTGSRCCYDQGHREPLGRPSWTAGWCAGS